MTGAFGISGRSGADGVFHPNEIVGTWLACTGAFRALVKVVRFVVAVLA